MTNEPKMAPQAPAGDPANQPAETEPKPAVTTAPTPAAAIETKKV